MTSRRIRLIYILGSGRCGSAVLSGVLGSYLGVFPTGELHWLVPRATDYSEFCACKKPVPACPFWSRVLSELRRSFDLDQFLRDSSRFERYPAFPTTVLKQLLHDRSLRGHLANLATMVRVITDQAGMLVVSDASKHPVRGWLFASLPDPDIEVKFLHIVRDGRSVVRSWSEDPPMPNRVWDHPASGPGPDPEWFRASSWTLSNLLSSLLGFLQSRRYLRVRYEDLVHDPSTTLARIVRFLDLENEGSRVADWSNRSLSFGHMVAGNRVRLGDDVRLEPSEDGNNNVGSSGLTFFVIGGWLQRLYGYS